MKKRILLLVAFITLTVWSCKKDSPIVATQFPEQVVVGIPDAISSNNQLKSLSINSCDSIAPFSGESIYQMVRVFIFVGKNSANFVQDVFTALKKYNIDKPMKFEYTGDDGNQKKVIVEEVTAANTKNENILAKYTMKLRIMDGLDTNKKAMQIFWNKETKEGFTIVSPYVFNKKDSFGIKNENLKYKIEFSPVKTTEYDQKMTVTLAGFSINPDEKYAISKFKMVVTKKGSIVTLQGTSNHPNVDFFDPINKGMSYAFVAKANADAEIGVIKLALPSNKFDSGNVYQNYAIEDVLFRAIANHWKAKGITIDKSNECVTYLLQNCQSPAYFDKTTGFKGSGTNKPGNFSTDVTNLDGLVPFVPAEVEKMDLIFEE